MPDIIKRLHYFNGQFLEEKDFNDEQDYHLDRLRRHNRLLHTSGIAEGLAVTGVLGAGDVSVGVGTALDNQGRLIVLSTGETLSLSNVVNKTVLVVISYDEIGVDPATVGNQGQPTRWEERPKVQLVEETGAPPEGTHIRLARLVVSGGGTVSSLDTSVRRLAGVRVGNELSIPRLRVSSDQLADNLWPELTADAARRVRLGDHLLVAGDVTVGGTLSGTLAANIVTAEQIANQAVGTAEIANLAVTDAKLADNAVTNAKLADNAVGTNEIANLAVTTGKIANLAVTGAKIEDLTIAAGKLADLTVTGAKIANGTISSGKLDTAAKALLDGALQQAGGTITGDLTVNGLINGFASGKRSTGGLSFGIGNIDGATATLTPNFRARTILLHGSASGRFDQAGNSNFEYGGVISGFAIINADGTVAHQSCHAPVIKRWSTGNFQFSTDFFTSIAACVFTRYYTVSQAISLQISVDSVSATQVVFKLSRTNYGLADLDGGYLHATVLILG